MDNRELQYHYDNSLFVKILNEQRYKYQKVHKYVYLALVWSVLITSITFLNAYTCKNKNLKIYPEQRINQTKMQRYERTDKLIIFFFKYEVLIIGVNDDCGNRNHNFKFPEIKGDLVGQDWRYNVFSYDNDSETDNETSIRIHFSEGKYEFWCYGKCKKCKNKTVSIRYHSITDYEYTKRNFMKLTGDIPQSVIDHFEDLSKKRNFIPKSKTDKEFMMEEFKYCYELFIYHSDGYVEGISEKYKFDSDILRYIIQLMKMIPYIEEPHVQRDRIVRFETLLDDFN